MENASKALMIAGGILFSILILTMIVYISTETSRFAKMNSDKKLVEEIEAFNKGYLAFNKSRMYGTEVISVYNKANEYNRKLDDADINNRVNIIIMINNNEVNIEYTSEFKNSIFKCKNVEYNNKTGKICKMEFEKVI